MSASWPWVIAICYTHLVNPIVPRDREAILFDYISRGEYWTSRNPSRAEISFQLLIHLWSCHNVRFCMRNPDQKSHACPTTELQTTTFPATWAERSPISSTGKLFHVENCMLVHASCFSKFLWFSDRTHSRNRLSSVTYIRESNSVWEKTILRGINVKQACWTLWLTKLLSWIQRAELLFPRECLQKVILRGNTGYSFGSFNG